MYLLAFLGGWPGAWLGQRYFRHKTKKVSFRVVFWLVVLLHMAVVGSAAYLVFGPVSFREANSNGSVHRE